jgi:hypothetical protein
VRIERASQRVRVLPRMRRRRRGSCERAASYAPHTTVSATPSLSAVCQMPATHPASGGVIVVTLGRARFSAVRNLPDVPEPAY